MREISGEFAAARERSYTQSLRNN